MSEAFEAHVVSEAGLEFVAPLKNLGCGSLFLATDAVLPFGTRISLTFLGAYLEGYVGLASENPQGLLVVFEADEATRRMIAARMDRIPSTGAALFDGEELTDTAERIDATEPTLELHLDFEQPKRAQARRPPALILPKGVLPETKPMIPLDTEPPAGGSAALEPGDLLLDRTKSREARDKDRTRLDLPKRGSRKLS